MSEDTIFVSGSTGNVGREVIKQLRTMGGDDVVIRAAILPHEKPKEEEGVSYHVFDFTDEKSWAAALGEANKVFLMRPPHISNIKRDMYPFLDFLRRKSIEQIAFLSVQGAGNNSFVPHHKVEQAILELDLPYTFVRPSFFMQNLSTIHLDEIRLEKRIFVPAGKGRTNFIDVRDIGEFFAKVLLEEGHIYTAYTITGEKSYSYAEVAALLSEELGDNIQYEHANPIAFLRYHKAKGKKLGHRLVMLALYSVARFSKADDTIDTLERVLGRKPISLRQFIRDHKELFSEEAAGYVSSKRS